MSVLGVGPTRDKTNIQTEKNSFPLYKNLFLFSLLTRIENLSVLGQRAKFMPSVKQ